MIARRWKLVAACVAVAIGLAVVWTISQTPIYTATAEILVKPPLGATGLGGAVQPFNIENERQIVDSLPVASLAAGRRRAPAATRERCCSTWT